MNRSSVLLSSALLAFAFILPASNVRATDDAGTLIAELSQQVRQYSDQLARCVDNTAARHARNATGAIETAAAASVEDCESVIRVFIASCSQNIQNLCENFAKDLRARELKRAADLITRLRVEQK